LEDEKESPSFPLDSTAPRPATTAGHRLTRKAPRTPRRENHLRDQTTHPQFRLKLEAAGFGVFVPVFFVTSGLRFDLHALFASPSTVARVPLFLLALYLADSRRSRTCDCSVARAR
jgi:hypothetical protein